MARKKVEFRPDPTGAGLLNKLYITPSQRRVLWRWCAYSVSCVAVLVIQDVILWRFRLLGGMIDLTPAMIALVCVMEGAESGGVFALCASIFYYYSGSAPGAYCIALIVLPGVAAALFRQSFLRRGFWSHWLCAGIANGCYQLGVLAMAVFLGQTRLGAWLSFFMNALLATAALPLIYPLLARISRIGGEKWKE